MQESKEHVKYTSGAKWSMTDLTLLAVTASGDELAIRHATLPPEEEEENIHSPLRKKLRNIP